MKISILALAGLVAATPVVDVEKRAHSHHHVKVQRYAVPDCVPESHIKKDMEVEKGQCVNFLGKEPGFISFRAKITYNLKGKLGKSEECRLYAYSEKDCKGKKQAMDDMHKYNGQCQNQDKLFGRSIYLKCMKVSDLDAADDFDVDEPKHGGIPGAQATSTKKPNDGKTTIHVNKPTPTSKGKVTVVGTPVAGKETAVVVKTETVKGTHTTKSSLTRTTLGAPAGNTKTVKWKTMTTMVDLPRTETKAKATATVTAKID